MSVSAAAEGGSIGQALSSTIVLLAGVATRDGDGDEESGDWGHGGRQSFARSETRLQPDMQTSITVYAV